MTLRRPRHGDSARPELSVCEFVASLRRLGVADGAVLMVHASLRKLGPVQGGAAGVVRALDHAMGPAGTVMMVLGARDDWAWVNERPEAERAELLKGTPAFDMLSTPAEPEVGTLAEVFRQTQGTLVSDHPEGRFAARGRLAAEFVANVPWDDYYGAGSPLQRLVDAGGKVLRLGADLNTVTLLHHAEHLCDVPHKRRQRRHRVVMGQSGAEVRVVDTLDDSNGIVDHPGEDYFAVILKAYFAAHPPPRATVGGAPSELLDARHLVDFAARWMTANLAPGGAGAS